MFFRIMLMLALATTLGADETQFLSRVRQLTFEGARAGEGYFSPDGQKIIFQSEREPENPFYQIYILDLTSGETTRVSTGTGKTTCAFFRPGSDRVLFASTHGDPNSKELQDEEIAFRASGKEKRYAWDYDAQFEIYEAGQDGTGLRNLTNTEGYDAEAAYSPDGKLIVFCSNRSAYPADKLSPENQKRLETDAAYFGEIYLMNADGSNVRQLTKTPGYDGGPFFTPDGKRIVWRHFDENGVIADVFTMNLDGSDVQQVTTFGSMSWAPYFHPSSDYLAFASNRLGFSNFEVFLVDRAGKKEPVQITSTDGFDGLPVFSPDGKRMAWTSSRHGGKGAQLYMAEWNDAAARAALESAHARKLPEAPKGHPPIEHSAATPAEKSSATENHGPDPKHDFEKAISESDLKVMVGHLSSDELEGRLTGTPGEKKAGEYIARRFKTIGLSPLTGSSYNGEFNFTSGVHPGEKNTMDFKRIDGNPHVMLEERVKNVSETGEFNRDENFLPLSFTDNGTTEGLLVFVGYGMVVPSETGGAPVYDSYDGVDVTGRIVMALRYVPEQLTPEQRQVFNRYAGLRFKALQARSRGAAGLLIVEGPNSPNPGKLVSLGLELGGATSGILGASIDLATAEKLLSTTGKTLKDLQTELDSGEKKIAFGVEDTLVRIETELKKESSTGSNIVAVLPPDGGATAETEYVLIGAHYDHLGHGPNSSSLARKDEEQLIHYGADDNASGVAAILESAEAIASADGPRKRGVIFAAWSGEEIGLLGSSAFCNKPPVPLEKIVANLNLDMVGRVKDNKLVIQAVGSSPVWKGMIERKNIAAGFALSLTDDPYLPTDVTSFYTRKIPGLHFFSGAHEDYHRPTDTAEKINYPDLARVSELVTAFTRELMNGDSRPEWVQVAQSAPTGGGRDTMRAYLGTIPDYASEDLKGVKLSGVRAGGPADKGGLMAEDVIIEFAGQAINNVYDYTYALDSVKIGEPVKIVVMRKDQKVTVTVVPEARK